MGIVHLPTSPAAAQAWDEFPVPADGQRLAVPSSLDGPQYNFLRTCLRDKNSISGASYWGAVVNNSSRRGDPDDGEATPYVDALYQDWRRRGVGIEPQRHILILIALENRAVAIHPGSSWADQNFDPNRVDMGKFGDYMRDGNTDLAVCNLVEAIDTYLTTLDTAGQPPLSVPQRGERRPAQPVGALPATAAAPAELPGGCVWGLFFLVLLFGLLLVRGRRKATARERAEMEAELARWQEQINAAGQRLLELENQHPLYLQSGSQRWEGESAELDQECADAVNHLFLLYSKAFELLQDAQNQAQRAKGGWSAKPYKDVLKTLRETVVRFETGEAEPNRRIFLPLTRDYENTAPGLLQDLDSAYAEALEHLEFVAEVQLQAGAAADACSRAAEAAMAAAEARGALELPVEPLMQELEPLLARRDELRARLGRDPLGIGDAFAEVTMQLDAVRVRGEQGNATVEQLRGPVSELGSRLRARVEHLRGQGVALREPGFEPEVRLDHGSAEAARAIEEVAAGQEASAVERLQRLQEGLQELEGEIEAWHQAPETLPRLRADLQRDRAQVEQRVPNGRRILDELAEEHAADAFRREADNLDELSQLLTRFDDWQAQILKAEGAHHYLAALADAEGCRGLLAQGSVLLDEIDSIHQRLEDARSLALGDLDTLRRQRGDVTNASGPGVDSELRRQLEQRASEVAGLLDAADEDRPNWLQVAAAAAATRQDLEELLQQAAEQRALHAQAREQAAQLENRLRTLDQQVESERRDRPHVARAVVDVHQRFDDLDRQLDSPEVAGDEQLHAVRDAASALEWAEGVLRSELQAIRLAEAELDSARDAVRALGYQHFGHGVAANTSGPSSELRRAESSAASNDWDEVLSASRRAKAEAEAESRRAQSEARRREQEQRRRLRQQRLQQAATAAAAVAAIASSQRASAAPSFTISNPFGGSSGGASRRSSGSSLSTSRSSFGGGASSKGGWTQSKTSRSWNARW